MGIESFYANIKIENINIEDLNNIFNDNKTLQLAIACHWDDVGKELSIKATLVSFLPACELLYKLCQIITTKAKIIEIETRKERDSNYEDMEYILYFIILFNQIEYLEEYKKLLEKSEDRDFYFDLLMQYLDSSWEISTEKILWPKDIKPLVEVIQLSKTDKTLAVQRLKKYLEKEWFKTLKEGLITNKQLEKGRYRGYWCIESAVLVKVLGLDDTDLRGCKYYPYDMAHFSE